MVLYKGVHAPPAQDTYSTVSTVTIQHRTVHNDCTPSPHVRTVLFVVVEHDCFSKDGSRWATNRIHPSSAKPTNVIRWESYIKNSVGEDFRCNFPSPRLLCGSYIAVPTSQVSLPGQKTNIFRKYSAYCVQSVVYCNGFVVDTARVVFRDNVIYCTVVQW